MTRTNDTETLRCTRCGQPTTTHRSRPMVNPLGAALPSLLSCDLCDEADALDEMEKASPHGTTWRVIDSATKCGVTLLAVVVVGLILFAVVKGVSQ